MGDRRPLSPGFRGTCRTTHDGGGLPETEEGEEGGIPAGITHDLVLQFDLPARRMEREERLLAFNGGDLNATLLEICKEGGGKDARFLLAHGADANLVPLDESGDDRPVLRRAAYKGHFAVVEALLDAGAGGPGAALEDAIGGGGHKDVVTLLLDRGANVDHPCRMGVTPLYWAAMLGWLEIANLLIQRGAVATASILEAMEVAEQGSCVFENMLLAAEALNVS